jgi:hypothetical protein
VVQSKGVKFCCLIPPPPSSYYSLKCGSCHPDIALGKEDPEPPLLGEKYVQKIFGIWPVFSFGRSARCKPQRAGCNSVSCIPHVTRGRNMSEREYNSIRDLE